MRTKYSGNVHRIWLSALLAAAVALAASAAAQPTERLDLESARLLVDSLQSEVESLRKLGFKQPVPVHVVDDDAAREHMLDRLQEFQPEEYLRRMQKAYELLRLVPPEFDLLATFLEVLREQAGGYYDPDSKSFYLLDDVPRLLASVVVAHELTHALEDQHFDLDRRLREAMYDDDQLLAHSAVHEGSATLLMTLYLSRQIFAGEVDAAAMQAYAESEVERAEVLKLLPAVFQRQLLVPYLVGSGFLVRGNLTALVASGYPAADVDRVYRDPPRSSEQILHPEKYWGARDDPRTVEIGSVGSLLGRRWERTAGGVLGELTLGLLVGAPTPFPPTVGAAQGGDAWTNEAATGWGGDRWQLWQRGDRAVVLLATVWDSEQHAREFAEALPRDSGLHWRLAGERVAIVAGDVGRKADRLLARMLR